MKEEILLESLIYTFDWMTRVQTLGNGASGARKTIIFMSQFPFICGRHSYNVPQMYPKMYPKCTLIPK